MTLQQRLFAQFREPHGLAGRLAGHVMATRPSNRARNLWTLDLLVLEPSHRVLEVGCGPGFALEELSRRVTSGEIRAVDHSELMVATAEARNRTAVASGRMCIACAPVEQLPAELTRFDRIYSANVVQFWRDPDRVIADLASRLVPGGVLATTYMPRNRNASAADTSSMAERVAAWAVEAGLEGVRTETLPLESVPVACVLGRRAS